MASLQQSKRSQNKQCTVKVRWGILTEDLSEFLLPKSGRKYFHAINQIIYFVVN